MIVASSMFSLEISRLILWYKFCSPSDARARKPYFVYIIHARKIATKQTNRGWGIFGCVLSLHFCKVN